METSGIVEGSTLERVRIGRERELSALVAGARHDQHVSFTKIYDASTNLDLDPIAYTGLADVELAVVQGDWRLVNRNPLRGGFIMRRISSSPVFSLRAAQTPSMAEGSSREELRAWKEAITQRRRKQISVEKPRRPRPKLAFNRE